MVMRPSTRLQLFKRVRRIPTSRSSHLGRNVYSTAGASEDYDVVIIGGGPAGLAFASALAASPAVNSSLRVALVEAGNLDRIRRWSQQDNGYSNRVSSITNDSKRFLTDIGGWQNIDESRTWPMEDMQVWDGISDSRIVFSASEIDDLVNPYMEKHFATRPPQLAQLTENLNLQRSLLLNLDRHQVVEILDNTTVSSIESEAQVDDSIGGGWPILHTSTGRKLRARLLVGADGPNSPVRKYARIESYGWAYDTRAIVATLFHAPRLEGLQKPNSTAYQRFLPTGPIAFLPLSPTTSSLVWSTKPPLASALSTPPNNGSGATTSPPSPGADPEILKLMINAAFRLPEISVRYLHDLILESHSGENKLTASQLAEEIKWRERSHGIDQNSAFSCFSSTEGIPPVDAEALPPLVTGIQTGTPASFPLRMSHADTYVGNDTRTVLIGDAAHTIHPLAGQGLNMGLADAEALADTIACAVAVGSDIGSRTALLPYSRSRYFENHKLLSVTDKLHKLYASTLPPLVWARSVGLEVINELDSVKAALMFSAGASSIRKDMEPGAKASHAAATAFEIGNGVVNAVGLLSRSALGLARAGLAGLANSSGAIRKD